MTSSRTPPRGSPPPLRGPAPVDRHHVYRPVPPAEDAAHPGNAPANGPESGLSDAEHSAEDLKELMRVCVALTTERNLLTLLGMILTQARRIAQSDAASLYLVEHQPASGPDMLRFKLSQNFSRPDLPLIESTVPIDRSSLAGYAAVTGEPLIIPDVYLLPSNVSYRLNRTFDDKFGYRTKSVLVIPMKTHRDAVIGVLQLINRKRVPGAVLASTDAADQYVEPFDQRSVELVTALAAQAAVAIENSMLYEDIERLFEGFVPGRRDCDRDARSNDLRALRSRRRHERRVGQGRGSRRSWRLSRCALHDSAVARAPLRRPPARFRQSGCAGRGAH